MGLMHITPDEQSDYRVNGFYFHNRPTFAPFMGVSAAWEPQIDSGTNALFRAAFGLMGAQSKNVVELFQNGARRSIDELGYVADGREIVRSVPPYAAFDVGLVWKKERIRVGFSIGAFLLLTEGPELPEVHVVTPVGQGNTTVTFEGGVAYLPSFLFVPQLVFGFDP